MIFYFSGTGNTRWVAELLSQELTDGVVDVFRYLQHPELYRLSTDEAVGICFPVYGWDAPQIAYRLIDFLQRELEHCPTYLYYVCTMGDDIGITDQRIKAHVGEYGWKFQSGFSIQMPNSYVCLPGFDVDSNELADSKLSGVKDSVRAVCEAVKLHADGLFQLTPGAMPWFKTVVLGGFFRRFLMKDNRFHSTSACVGCGKCEISCPAGNITMKNGHPTFSGHCTMCLSCYHHCPHHALHWGSQTKSKGQYLCPEGMKE